MFLVVAFGGVVAQLLTDQLIVHSDRVILINQRMAATRKKQSVVFPVALSRLQNDMKGAGGLPGPRPD